MPDQLSASSNCKVSWFTLALLWSAAWLACQAWLLYQKVVSPLSSVLVRQSWWQEGDSMQLVAWPLLAFLLPAMGLYVVFAWANASAFRILLLPRLHRPRERLVAFLGQLLLTTFSVSLLGAWLYPTSVMGEKLDLMLVPRTGQWLACCLGIVVSAYFFLWLITGLLRHSRLALWSAPLLLVAPMAMPLASAHRHRPADMAQPDIILIGVDSLRPDHLPQFGAPFDVAPNIERFVEDSVVFSDALTTQAHTFPATTSILTGLYPTSSGARGNLFPPTVIKTGHSIAWRFKSAGWNTVYGTDETRFSNIDEIYGFQRIANPGIGIPDYLMSFVSDTVLVNLLANTAPGRWLFPHLYGNRAVAHAYRPESFSRRLELALDGNDSRPLFLYVHFCSGHWPYEPPSLFHKDRFDTMPAGFLADTDANYLRAIGTADEQVGHLLAGLKQRGRLDNAIIVLFSDHGEDFGMQKDVIRNDAGQILQTGLNGHGSSAARESQVRVLLAWQRYGAARFASRETSLPVSLVDIAPTLADLALPPDDSVHYDGYSLKPTLSGGSQADLGDRVRFVESSKFFAAMNARTIAVDDVIEEAGSDFGFSPTGRVEVLPQNIASQIGLRERAAWSGRQVALLPVDPLAPAVLLDRQQHIWRAAAPTGQTAKLMEQLCQHWQADPITMPRCATWISTTAANVAR